MAHDHSHHHHHYSRAFAIGIVLNTAFILVETVCGLLAGSLALLADAGHNLSDVLGLAMAWAAFALAGRPQSDRRTYGWRKATVLAALFNAVILLIAMGGISWEAIRRFSAPAAPAGVPIIIVAAAGVLINGATALLFMSGRKEDLNITGAFLHMAADAGVSAGVVLAGAGILVFHWQWLDPVISLVIVAIILAGTWGLFRDSFELAIDAVPRHIDTDAVRRYLMSLPGVVSIHCLHIWGMSTTEAALTVHAVKEPAADGDALIDRIEHDMHERFHIGHTTIQWEHERPGDRTPAAGSTGCRMDTPRSAP